MSQPSAPDQGRRPDDYRHAFDAAHRLYESDVQGFAGRMSLFLVVESALLAATVAVLGGANGHLTLSRTDRLAACAFGAALSGIWLAVAAASYVWIKRWRGRMLLAAEALTAVTQVPLPTDVFLTGGREPRSEWARPTPWICMLPALYLFAWVYLVGHSW